ncbi:TIR domain-containing protein [Kribbella sp. NPDC051770]|uniref:toll/interleukin-1 receptor domain-containing protein n=1 Tax=Kribbella sp. NPDC051770 TaxID=3155413 RepID=UPI0034251C04
MKIFISWSGTSSRELAEYLKPWLTRVIQQLRPFVSTQDIAKGKQWNSAVAEELEGTSDGIICVTRENQSAPWLNFEAGALAKATAEASVRPVLLDLAPSEVIGPLASFQHTALSNEGDVFDLVKSINSKCQDPLPDEILKHTFDREWPQLDQFLQDLRSRPSPHQKPTRNSNEILAEVLDRIRALERDNAHLSRMTERLIEGLYTGRVSAGFGYKRSRNLDGKQRVEFDGTLIDSEVDHSEYGRGTVVGVRATQSGDGSSSNRRVQVAFEGGRTVWVPPQSLFRIPGPTES